jgi:hypothetical protein
MAKSPVPTIDLAAVRNPQSLHLRLNEVLRWMTATRSEIDQVIESLATSSQLQLPEIKAALELGGRSPLNLTGLVGKTADPQFGGLLTGTVLPPPNNYAENITFDLQSGSPVRFQRYYRGTVNGAPAWVQAPVPEPTNMAKLDLANIFLGLQTFKAGVDFVDPAHGAAWSILYREEEVTLSTVGVTTDSTGLLIAGNCLLLGVPQYITQAISGGGVTGLQTGDQATPSLTRFATTATLTVGAGLVGLDQWKGSAATDAAGPLLINASKVRFTATGGTPTQGKVRVGVWQAVFSPQTS